MKGWHLVVIATVCIATLVVLTPRTQNAPRGGAIPSNMSDPIDIHPIENCTVITVLPPDRIGSETIQRVITRRDRDGAPFAAILLSRGVKEGDKVSLYVTTAEVNNGGSSYFNFATLPAK